MNRKGSHVGKVHNERCRRCGWFGHQYGNIFPVQRHILTFEIWKFATGTKGVVLWISSSLESVISTAVDLLQLQLPTMMFLEASFPLSQSIPFP
jgi:hypothetical protein